MRGNPDSITDPPRIGARAVSELKFNGFEWYEAYGERHADDLTKAALWRFSVLTNRGRAGRCIPGRRSRLPASRAR
jgi:hypothetical protein